MGSGLSVSLSSSSAGPPTCILTNLYHLSFLFIFGFEGPQLCPLYLPFDPMNPTLAPSISGNCLSSTVQLCRQGVVPLRTLLDHRCLYPHISASASSGTLLPGPTPTFCLALVHTQLSSWVSFTLSIPDPPSPNPSASSPGACLPVMPQTCLSFSAVLSAQAPLGCPLL